MDPVGDEMLASFVVDSHMRSHPDKARHLHQHAAATFAQAYSTFANLLGTLDADMDRLKSRYKCVSWCIKTVIHAQLQLW